MVNFFPDEWSNGSLTLVNTMNSGGKLSFQAQPMRDFIIFLWSYFYQSWNKGYIIGAKTRNKKRSQSAHDFSGSYMLKYVPSSQPVGSSLITE